MRTALFIALGFALAGCTATAPVGDPTVMVDLRNEGARPMQCRVQFGHWVDRDLGVLAPGARTRFQIQQQPKDGALYVERDDRQRKMMIENIFCNIPNDLQATVGQVDLAPARATRMQEIEAACAAPATGRVQCRPVVLKP
jgi:hypothetical protein